MGNFHVNCRVERTDRTNSVEVTSVLVDTGSAYTWVNEKLLEGIGIERQKKDIAFVTANGRQITRSMGYAIVHVDGIETVDEVVFAEPGDLQLLGARSLEGLNLRVGWSMILAQPPSASAAIQIGNLHAMEQRWPSKSTTSMPRLQT